MRRYILLIAVVAATLLPGFSQGLEKKALDAYDNKNYPEAIETYRQILETEGASSRLYYNLGNAYYRNGDKGRAVLSYERSLRLDPRNKETVANLDFVEAKLTDRLIEDENILSVAFGNIRNLMSTNGWAIVGMVSFLLFIAGFALYFFSSSILLRKTGFFGGLFLLFVSILSNVLSYRSYRWSVDCSYAIVLNDSTQLSTVAREAIKDEEKAFVLHEGTKVEKVDSLKAEGNRSWYRVKTADRREAWIDGGAIEEI